MTFRSLNWFFLPFVFDFCVWSLFFLHALHGDHAQIVLCDCALVSVLSLSPLHLKGSRLSFPASFLPSYCSVCVCVVYFVSHKLISLPIQPLPRLLSFCVGRRLSRTIFLFDRPCIIFFYFSENNIFNAAIP